MDVKRLKIRAYSLKHAEAICERFEELGFKHVADWNPKKHYEYGPTTYFGIDAGGQISSWAQANSHVATLGDLYKTVTVKLNDKYTAEIQDGYVKVGCQEIPFDAVLELADKVKEQTSKAK